MRRHDSVLVAVLIASTSVAALISSVGAPFLPTIARTMGVPLSTAQWTLTVTVLVGAVCSPIMGRLGDGPRRRGAIIFGLAVTSLGCVVAALAAGIWTLVAGRALMGVGLSLVPLTMAAARDHFPREKAHSTIALLSVCTAAAVAVGYPLSGFISQLFGLAAAYWFSAAATGLTAIVAILVVPRSTARPETAALDLPGTVLLTSGLLCLLIGVSEAKSWGWGSASILGLLAAAAVILTVWVLQQLRSPAPLVQLRLLRHPAVLAADVCAIVMAVAMYMYMSAISEFIQIPPSAGYGLGESITLTGLSLLPMGITSVAVSRMLPMLTARFGGRALLPLGCLIVAFSGAYFAIAHTAVWQAFVMMAILGVGLGLTGALLPGLIVKAVPAHETGSALGFYTVARYVGYAFGSAVTALILATHTPAGDLLPDGSGFLTVFWIGAGICVVAGALMWILPNGKTDPAPQDVDQIIENAELGPVGLVALPDSDAPRQPA